MSTRVIFPPRPKGKMRPSDLPMYEQSGRWVAQRKFNGCRNLVHVTPEGRVEVFSRYGDQHKAFSINREYQEEIIESLNIDKGVEYWLDSELMTKTANSGGEIVLYDVLQVGRYFFGRPNQLERLRILRDICGNPQNHDPEGIALEISPRLWMAETFDSDFPNRFDEALENDKIEGLVLRKKDSALDNFGEKYYETNWLIRCRKSHKNYQY